MQTFLPYPDFKKSADSLDWQYPVYNRLTGQVKDGIAIAGTLLGLYGDKGNFTHPAVQMWNLCECLLVNYTWDCLFTLERKVLPLHPDWNYNDWEGQLAKLQELAVKKVFMVFGDDYDFAESGMPTPKWLGDERFHSSHRAVLLGKNFKWYSQFGWTEEPAVRNEKGKWPYWWPVPKEE